MNQKKVLFITFVIISMVFTSGAYAYWFDTQGDNDEDVLGAFTIGTGETVETTLTVGDESSGTDVLVPVTYASSVSTPVKVDTISLSYLVEWETLGDNEALGELVVDITEVRSVLETETTLWSLASGLYGDMFTIVISGDGPITLGTPSNITVTLEFTTAPASQAIYNIIASSVLEIDLDFTVTVN